MRRTPADRLRRWVLADTSVSATTPVMEPGPVLPNSIAPPCRPDIRGRAETRRSALEPEVAE